MDHGLRGSRSNRSAFSLVELVVVMAILGMLLALLIPAVQSSRESTRRMTCQSHLHQVALAIQARESAEGALPRLYNGDFLSRPRAMVDEFHFHSWRTAILPALDQGALYAALNLSVAVTTEANRTVFDVELDVFLCPSTSNWNPKVPDIMAFAGGFPSLPTRRVETAGAGRSDYEVVAGVLMSRQHRNSADLSPIRFGAWGEPTYDPDTGRTIRDRKARLADVTDGLSNTLLIAERAGRPDILEKGRSADPYPYANPQKGTDHHQAAWAISTHIWWLVAPEPAINVTNRTGIFAQHPGGANVVLCDGSVRFLGESTSRQILEALATRSGREVVSLP